MKTSFLPFTAVAAFMFAIWGGSAGWAEDANWAAVGAAIGKPGAEMPGGVYRVGLPRSDLHVIVDGVTVAPGLALGSWVAFQTTGQNTAMAMGDLVLTEDEVRPVMTRLIEGGIEITALHNHLLRATPATIYMHIAGRGDPVKLATTIHAALALSKTPFATPAAAAAPPPSLDIGALDKIFGHPGKVAGGLYQIAVRRAETITEHGMAIPPAMGTGIGINFQPTGGGKAAITGDLVLRGAEVNPVLRVLREGGVEVTALHSHMLDERPRLFFMHVWANDDATKLARTLHAAFEKMNLAKP